jgi:hypothetical protein
MAERKRTYSSQWEKTIMVIMRQIVVCVFDSFFANLALGAWLFKIVSVAHLVLVPPWRHFLTSM